MCEQSVLNIEENFFGFRRLLGRDVSTTLSESSEHLCINSEHPFALFNCVLKVSPPSDKASGVIRDISKPFEEKGVPFTWWYRPGATDHPLSQHLLQEGFEGAGCATGMAMPIDSLSTPTKKAGFCCQRVRTQEELEIWCKVFVEGYGLPESMYPPFLSTNQHIGCEEKGPVQFYLGYLNGEPVATASLFLDECAGVYGVSTLKQSRKKGLAKVMTEHLLWQAKQQGYSQAVLLASDEALSLYEKLGFQEYCQFMAFVRAPSQAC